MDKEKPVITGEENRMRSLQEIVLEALRNSSGYIEDANKPGNFEYEIYSYYDDYFSDKTVKEILESDDPEEYFYEKISDVYVDADTHEDLISEIVNKIQSMNGWEFDFRQFNSPDDLYYAVSDEVFDHVECNYPYDAYLNHEYRAVVVMDTGDANVDYVCNSRYPSFANINSEQTMNEKIPEYAGILWLAKTQGYTEEQLRNALAEGDMVDPHGFLESMCVEMANCPTQMPAVVFLVKMSLRDMIKITVANNRITKKIRAGEKVDESETFTLSTKTTTGLYSGWSGAGSLFEIQLEKDIDVPIKFIHTCYPDLNDSGWWSIDEAYGMCASEWKDTILKWNIIEDDAVIK